MGLLGGPNQVSFTGGSLGTNSFLGSLEGTKSVQENIKQLTQQRHAQHRSVVGQERQNAL